MDRLVGGGQVLVQRRVLAELHGERAQVDRLVHRPLRGGRVETGWQSHSLSERSDAWLARRQPSASRQPREIGADSNLATERSK